MVIYWQGQHISYEVMYEMYEYNKILNAALYIACDVSVQSKDLNEDTHGCYKYRG